MLDDPVQDNPWKHRGDIWFFWFFLDSHAAVYDLIKKQTLYRQSDAKQRSGVNPFQTTQSQQHILPQGNNLKLSLSFSQVAIKMLEVDQSVG